jgi:hypothetical protein
MGSSKGGGGNPNTPSGMPVGPMGGAPPPGIAPRYNPSFVSFLPSDPNASATGLTQSMLDQINRPAPPPPAMGASAMDPDAMRAMIAQMITQQMPAAQPTRQFGPYTLDNGLMGYNYRGGANRSGGGGFGGGVGASGGGGYSSSARR